MNKILLIDNYDSFTYNLFQMLAEQGVVPTVVRNDALTIEEVEAFAPSHVVLSPGPGHPTNPRDFGVCAAVIDRLSGRVPILGVCLGHQGLAARLGGTVVRAPEPFHGKVSVVRRESVLLPFPDVLMDLPERFEAMRYHSLMVRATDLPASLAVTARTEGSNLIMGLQHREHPTYGVQFHPESIGTPQGALLLKRFIDVRL